MIIRLEYHFFSLVTDPATLTWYCHQCYSLLIVLSSMTATMAAAVLEIDDIVVVVVAAVA